MYQTSWMPANSEVVTGKKLGRWVGGGAWLDSGNLPVDGWLAAQQRYTPLHL
jgi:hypothetical protein